MKGFLCLRRKSALAINKRCFERLLITEFIKEDSPLLPNPCHFQIYDQSMSQLSSGSKAPFTACPLSEPERCSQSFLHRAFSLLVSNGPFLNILGAALFGPSRVICLSRRIPRK